ncbi:phospholipase A [Myroides sp. LJL119]
MVNKVMGHQLALVCIFFISINLQGQEKEDLLFQSKHWQDNNTLVQRWDLSAQQKRSTFTIAPYKPIYLLPGRWSNRPNTKPTSFNANNVSQEALPYEPWEIKFQISFKTKVAQGLFKGKGDIWLAFTQTANWQAYNEKLSRPFRELNYEPEVIFNYPLNWRINQFRFVMGGIGFNHQSNGKSRPESRSWNRVIFHLGMEYKNWTFSAKPWLRLKEKGKDDDNPRIQDYVGKAEFMAIYKDKGHVYSLLVRSNLRFNPRYKGYVEFTWAYPIKDNLKFYFTASNGYGDSLIDYNWSQTNIGLGISLVEW